MDFTSVARELHRIGAVRFGRFTLKDGRESPFYVDLRILIARPASLRLVAAAMVERAREIPHACLAAIPYAGLPLGIAMSLASDTPLVYPRKEAKDYGTKKRVEGVFEAGDRALVIDDVITSGGAKVEAIAPLREAGLVVEDVLVVVDREESGAQVLESAGLRLHSVLKISEALRALVADGALAEDDARRALAFIGKA